MDTITKSDFLAMVHLQHLEVLTSEQMRQNEAILKLCMEKALTNKLSKSERTEANIMVENIANFDCWCVLRDDFSKAILYTRREQIEWEDAEKGEFGEILKARSGVYKLTGENKKLGRVGQKYGEKEVNQL